MKISKARKTGQSACKLAGRPAARSGFTLIELLVVIAIIGILAGLLLPVLSGAKVRAQRTQCMGNIRQLAVGMNLFPLDYNDRYCPAGWENPSFQTVQLSWDSWINRYIGGSAQPADLQQALNFADSAPAILACPADRFTKIVWMGGTQPDVALRSYAMNACGTQYGGRNTVDTSPVGSYQVDDLGRTYKLPDLSMPDSMGVRHGVGIYWQDYTSPIADWNALGYKTSVVRDPSRNILLCENTHGQQCAQNIWTCCCIGPVAPGITQNELYQINSNSPPQSPTAMNSQSQGMLQYLSHKYRFNYAFCDGHVQALKVEQTIGNGTLAQPQGMWTAQGPY
jgi:prepilin-type N-terminal cleavage/methylation domain-containing protein/prepilin-type processing-associated H-X9-DG protein